jgi:PAS domain S-box-containing protein
MNTSDGNSRLDKKDEASALKHADLIGIKNESLSNELKNITSDISRYLSNVDHAVVTERCGAGINIINDLFFSIFKLKKTSKDLIGKPIEDAFESPIGQMVINQVPGLNETSKRRLRQTKKKRLRLSHELTIQVKYFPVIENDKLVSRIWVFEDVTIQSLTESNMAQREEKYRGILENMELGILEVDNDGIVVRAYDRFCAMTGYSQSELMGRDALEILVPLEQRYILQQQTADRELGKAAVYEVQIIKKGGEKIWVLISGAPIYDSNQNIVGTIGLHYDITKRKQSMTELKRAKSEAEAAKEAEKQFLANVSHEMRTPLNAILGMTNLLKGTKLTEEQSEYLEMLDSSSNMLHSLITDILDISKIDAGEVKINKEPFNLISILNVIVRTFSIRMESQPVTIEFIHKEKENLWVNGDLLLFKQILNNLIGNACKFTKKGYVSCKLLVEKIDESNVFIHIDIVDTGIGIDESEQELIFQKFKQGSNNKEEQYSGTGLGLVITKKLVELQDGTIGVKSRVGKGSIFSVSIPYEISKQVSQKEEKLIDISQLEQSIVLIVEDNYLNQRYITTLMKKWGIEYKLAENGLVAVECCRDEKYDLILMDVNMPKMDGYQASREILNAEGPNFDTPIVALTASGLKHTRTETERAGMCDFLLKPLHPEDLKKILIKYLKQKDYMETNNSEFKFDESLDVDYLNSIYDGDVEYAKEMFEIFFDSSAVEFRMIEGLLEDNSMSEAKSIVHKLKPSFSMVGLTQVGLLMDELERKLEDDTQNEYSKALFSNISEMYYNQESLLRSELDKMRSFLN